MNIIIHSYSTIGKRSKNEDAMELINNLDNKESNYNKLLYAGIYDGHGGSNISKLIVENNYISKYFCNVNSEISNKLNNFVKLFS